MHLKNLKGRTIRGGLSSVSAQVASFAVRLTTLMLLARQLKPDDFGLVGMVTAVTGALFFFRDFGLSAASIQIGTITEDQLSSLFWVNIGIGIILALITLIAAPAIVLFYSEPRLLEITAALSAGFILNASGIQHSAVLQRQMRFGVLALVNVISLIVSGAFALIAAQLGAGYWALVIMALTAPITLSTGLWITSGWTPHRPRKGTQIRPLIRFGGLITLNNLVMYVANNSDKVLVGRFLGADALGSYGRAYQLASIPIDNLNSAASEVAFSALSRLKENPMRLKRYFLNGYSLLLLVSIPIAVSCGLFAEDIVRIALGAQWNASVPIFRWLAPTILTSAIISPFGWFIYSLGMPGRGLSMALVLTPALICGCFYGLQYGPLGVAQAYSIVMLLWVGPAIIWSIHGTILSLTEILRTLYWPTTAGIISGFAALRASVLFEPLTPILRLTFEEAVLLLVYVAVIFSRGKYRQLCKNILSGISSMNDDMPRNEARSAIN